MKNNRAVGTAVEAGRRWEVDEHRAPTSWEIHIPSPGNAGGSRARGTVPPSRPHLHPRRVPG